MTARGKGERAPGVAFACCSVSATSVQESVSLSATIPSGYWSDGAVWRWVGMPDGSACLEPDEEMQLAPVAADAIGLLVLPGFGTDARRVR